jgi:uncharacterized protein (DUF2141 family)
MKRILTSMISAALAAGLAGQAAAADLTVRIAGIETASGTVHIAVFDAGGWAENEAAAGGTVAAEEGAELTLTGLQPGAYGIKVYQDVDGNGELNLGMWRIPTEPYGFSNGAPARMGPPKFDKAGFELTEAGTVQTVTLR